MPEKKIAGKETIDGEDNLVMAGGIQREIFTSTRPEVIARAILENLYYAQGRVPQVATLNDWYMALAYTIRDRMMEGWVKIA